MSVVLPVSSCYERHRLGLVARSSLIGRERPLRLVVGIRSGHLVEAMGRLVVFLIRPVILYRLFSFVDLSRLAVGRFCFPISSRRGRLLDGRGGLSLVLSIRAVFASLYFPSLPSSMAIVEGRRGWLFIWDTRGHKRTQGDAGAEA